MDLVIAYSVFDAIPYKILKTDQKQKVINDDVDGLER